MSDSEDRVASKHDQQLLFAERVEAASGKTIEALEYSRQKTRELMLLYRNELPQSVMRADKKSRDERDLASHSYDDSREYTGAFQQSSAGCKNGALSAFPQNIGRAVTLLYSKEGDTVVDPFAGHNSRMELVVKEGRNYIGCDVSAKFMQFNREQADRLRAEHADVKIELYETDSRKMSEHIEQWAGDFTLTSPPYYDIEHYGDEYQQLGNARSYNEFILQLAEVARQNFYCLKSGSFCVWFVNDFRRDGVFHSYHIDCQRILKDAGFVPWDMLITDFGGSFGACFPAQVVERKILPKRHEYGVVMRKL